MEMVDSRIAVPGRIEVVACIVALVAAMGLAWRWGPERLGLAEIGLRVTRAAAMAAATEAARTATGDPSTSCTMAAAGLKLFDSELLTRHARRAPLPPALKPFAATWEITCMRLGTHYDAVTVHLSAIDGSLVGLVREREDDAGEEVPEATREQVHEAAVANLTKLGVELGPFLSSDPEDVVASGGARTSPKLSVHLADGAPTPTPTGERSVTTGIRLSRELPGVSEMRLVLETNQRGEQFRGFTLTPRQATASGALPQAAEEEDSSDGQSTLLGLLGVVIALTYATALVVSWRMLRRDELSLRSWFIPAALFPTYVAIRAAVELLTGSGLLAAGIVCIFLILGMVIFWWINVLTFASGEALWHEVFSGRFADWTALLRRRFGSRRLALPLVRGVGLGAVLGAYSLLCAGLSAYGADALPTPPKSVREALTFPLPIVESVMEPIFRVAIFSGVLRLFLQPLLARWLRPLPALAAVAVLTAPAALPAASGPAWQVMALGFPVALLLGWLIHAHGFLLLAVVEVTSRAIAVCAPLQAWLGGIGWGNRWIWPALLPALLLWGLRCRSAPEAQEDLEDLLSRRARTEKEVELLRHELRMAAQVQLSLLPVKLPTLPSIEVRATCLPAREVGGDFYDVMGLSGGRLAVVIGDVSGKGLHAALYMAQAIGTIRALARHCDAPIEVMSVANDVLKERLGRGIFITALYCALDPATGRVRYVRAGHLPPLWLHRGQTETEVPAVAGLGLGVAPSTVFRDVVTEAEIQLAPGDTLVLFTDGLTENFDAGGEEYGLQRFRDACRAASERPLAELEGMIFMELERFRGGRMQHDDATMLLIRYHGTGET
ncbi:MAG: serine/threonine-protein phosphatase [Candidatus Schekmanbacteria bacterium]|nr:serine/threonine-protein phosphatase [Candidatus Schekmanbacteria bacterium]